MTYAVACAALMPSNRGREPCRGWVPFACTTAAAGQPRPVLPTCNMGGDVVRDGEAVAERQRQLPGDVAARAQAHKRPQLHERSAAALKHAAHWACFIACCAAGAGRRCSPKLLPQVWGRAAAVLHAATANPLHSPPLSSGPGPPTGPVGEHAPEGRGSAGSGTRQAKAERPPGVSGRAGRAQLVYYIHLGHGRCGGQPGVCCPLSLKAGGRLLAATSFLPAPHTEQALHYLARAPAPCPGMALHWAWPGTHMMKPGNRKVYGTNAANQSARHCTQLPCASRPQSAGAGASTSVCSTAAGAGPAALAFRCNGGPSESNTLAGLGRPLT